MIIGVDGNVATGKSTLCRELARRLGVPLFAEYPPAPAEASGAPGWDAQQHYLAAEAARAAAPVPAGVLDRSIVSQAAHVHAAGDPGLLDRMRERLAAPGAAARVVLPGVLLFLVDDADAAARLESREAGADRQGTARYLATDGYRERIERFLRRLAAALPESVALLPACSGPERAEAALAGLRPLPGWSPLLAGLEASWR